MTTVIAALAGANTINQMMYNVNQIRSGITFSSNSGIRLPLGTTAQRPTGAAGAFRYNTQLSQFEGYTADGWGSIGGGGLGVFKLVAGTYTANSGDRLAVSTTAATRTVTLPSSPAADAIVEFMDKDASFATNNLLISRNGSTIEGSSNTNAYIASMSTDVQLANTNAYIAAVATREAAHTANTLSHLANTNTYTVRTTGGAQTMYPSLVVANTFVAQHGMPMRITGGNNVVLALSDNGKLLVCTNTAGAMSVRIPNNSAVAFPIGAEISLVNVLTHATANTLGIAQTAGVILQSKEASNTVADRFTSATLKKTAINTWLLIGNLA